MLRDLVTGWGFWIFVIAVIVYFALMIEGIIRDRRVRKRNGE